MYVCTCCVCKYLELCIMDNVFDEYLIYKLLSYLFMLICNKYQQSTNNALYFNPIKYKNKVSNNNS